MKETSKVKVDCWYIGTSALFNIDILIILKPIPLRNNVERSRHANEGTGSGCHWNRTPPFEEQPEVTEGQTSADIFRLPMVIVIRVKRIGFGNKVQGKETRQPQHVLNTAKNTKAGESDLICYSEHLVVQKSRTIYLS